MGAMVKRNLGAGEAIRSDDLMRPSDHGFMAAVLSPGMRAVTINVDAASGSSGLIWPGDRVDLILTQMNNDPEAPARQADQRAHGAFERPCRRRRFTIGGRRQTETPPQTLMGKIAP